jgi:hypothetical protein
MNEGRRLTIGVAAAAMLVFVVHALNYLYFFVDDEAIPYVYAQNVLHGKGLIYNTIEGRVEGYSDFLHVGLATFNLALVRALHLPKITVFFIGKAWSIACAGAILVLVWMVLRRLRVHAAAAMTGLAFLALAPPLAVWSCSSLETVPFALTVTVLVAALLIDADRSAAAAAILLVLERIDGFVYAGALIGAFLITTDAPRRRVMVARIVLPVAAAFTAYHAWRWWYFGHLLPAPLEAKILYKLKPHANLVVKAPDESYLRRFIGMFGWPVAGAMLLGSIAAFRSGVARRLLLGIVPLFVYVSLVGDWMFGFRFFVGLIPVLALFIAVALNPLARRWPPAVAILAIVSTVYLGIVASRSVELYRRTENVETFLRAPSRDFHRFFWPYYGLYEAGRKLMRPGEVVAYNQAGFIPFMLDLDNVDDLGICSRFYAELPTTDLYFTEVGRYSPLTNKRELRAGQAYLLYGNVQYVLSRTDILSRANGDRIPDALFGGFYQLVQVDRDGQNAIYRRTAKPADKYQTNPQAFTENVAHVSYLRRASIDGVTVPASEYQRRLRFLQDQTADLPYTGRLTIRLDFAERDELVRAVTAASVRTSEPSTLKMTLTTAENRVVYDAAFQLERDHAMPIESVLPAGVRASGLTLELSSAGPAYVWLTDVRVQGQTPELERYINQKLQFPSPLSGERR